MFLRVAGIDRNRVYGGEWWFDLDLLSNLERSYSRIYFGGSEKKPALRDTLREFLALSVKWNQIGEVWALEIPPDETITGFSSQVAPQKLFHDLPLNGRGNRMFVGRARQIFFPVENPLWANRYRDLTF